MSTAYRIHRFRQTRNARHRASVSVAARAAATAFVIVLLFIAGTPIAIAGAAAGVYLYFAKDLTPPEAIAQQKVAASTRIYDRNGQLLYEVFDPHEGRRTPVKLSDVPFHLKLATIATEDATFYDNMGVDLRGITRAALAIYRAGEVVQGGSSITQQLVKNVVIPEEERAQPLLTRKIKEVILAVELTRRYSKDQILEWYLNQIFYGNLAYGISAAAESYFGKSVKDLTLAEAAMLAGLPQAPSLYSPLENPTAAKRRQEEVLGLMLRQGFITAAEAAEARAEKLQYAKPRFALRAPHFVMYVRQLIAEKYGLDALQRGGLHVTTSLDIDLQEQAEGLVREHVARSAAQHVTDGALVAIRPQTGEILTMVGSADYFNSDISGQLNVALAERQPGSSFKPFTYLTAFMKGYSPATMLLDIPTTFPDGTREYRPKNVDSKFRGPVTIRSALAMSLNIPAVRTIQFTGVQPVLDTAHRLGINGLNRKNTYGLSLTLGGGEVTLLDLVYAYSAFANDGVMSGAPVPLADWKPGFREVNPVAILRVVDALGNVLEEYREPQRRPVVAPQFVYQITSILSDNRAREPFFGSNNPLKLSDRPVAAKTGTTDDNQDAWTVGYTPDLVAGVWVGNADNTPMIGGFGSTNAAPIWREFMETALRSTPPRPFQEPEGLEHVDVCPTSGLLPTPYCPTPLVREVFLRGKAPKQTDGMYQPFRIDKRTDKLATAATPPDEVEAKVFFVVPPEALEWAKTAEVPQPPTEFSAGVAPAALSGPTISSPSPGSYLHGLVAITGTTALPDLKSFRLEVGPGTAPTAWTPIGQPGSGPVAADRLGVWDTRGFDGLNTIRLTVEPKNGPPQETTAPVIVDNSPPAVRLVQPAAGASVGPNADGQRRLTVEAAATDNLGLAVVEFRVDDKPIARLERGPYRFEWSPEPGQHRLVAVAADLAGNETTSEQIQVAVR